MIYLGVILSSIGLGFLVYGKRQHKIIPLLSGIGLISIPYLIPNIAIAILGGAILMAIPYFIRY